MASGKTHAAATIGTAVGLVVGYGAAYITGDPGAIGVLIVGNLSGVLIGPDLDVDGGNISNYYIRKMFRFDQLWTLFWLPYAQGFKHRSIFSHGPVVSTILRLLYLLFPIFVILFKDQDTPVIKLMLFALVSQLMALPLGFLVWYFWPYVIDYGLYYVAGLTVSDLLHLAFD